MQNAQTATGPAVEERTALPEARAGEIEREAGRDKVSFLEEDAAAIKAKREEMKAALARQVREDSHERSALTPEEIIVELDDYFRYGIMAVGAILTEMADEEGYRDIKSVTTATGLLFVYSDSFIAEEQAAVKSLVEEAKSLLAAEVRTDSHRMVRLTPIGELYARAPDTDSAIIDVLLKQMQSEQRFADIKKVTADDGEVYFHSDRYLVESYAATLLRSMAGNHYATIGETVREDSRIYPRTTNVTVFGNRELYGIPPGDLDTLIYNLLRKPEYSDIKRIVHPFTLAQHLYSDRYIVAERAWAMMDWEEVGRANNP